jgi:hypothetical protein
MTLVMTDNIRIDVSTYLTRILLFCGRLEPDMNPQLLPVTVKLILPHVKELEELEKSKLSFSQVFKENILLREEHTQVFTIPPALLVDPTLNGLYRGISDLVNPLVKNYCVVEKSFLMNELRFAPLEQALELLGRTLKDCELLELFSSAESRNEITTLREWVKAELEKRS